MLAAGLLPPPTVPPSPTTGPSTPVKDDDGDSDASSASSNAASTATPAATATSANAQPAPSPTQGTAAALSQVVGANSPPAPTTADPTNSSAATPSPQTSPTPQGQVPAAQTAASAAAATAAAAAAAASATSATAPQTAQPSPLPAAGTANAAPAPGQADPSKTATSGAKVTTGTSTASTATSTTPTSGYAAQLASQQAGATNNTPANDPQTAGSDTDGTAPAVTADKPLDPLKDATAATVDPKTAQAAALPGAAPAQAANVQTAAATQTAATTSSAATAAAVVQQVSVQVSKAAVDGVDHINVQLNPPELGHVEVRMEVGPSGHFSAVFAADRPQTVNLLQSNAHELTRSLQDAGVRTDAGSLSFNLRGQNQQGNTGWSGAFNGGGHAATPSWSNTPDETPAPAAIYANSSVGTGRVDIRV